MKDIAPSNINFNQIPMNDGVSSAVKVFVNWRVILFIIILLFQKFMFLVYKFFFNLLFHDIREGLSWGYRYKVFGHLKIKDRKVKKKFCESHVYLPWNFPPHIIKKIIVIILILNLLLHFWLTRIFKSMFCTKVSY